MNDLAPMKICPGVQGRVGQISTRGSWYVYISQSKDKNGGLNIHKSNRQNFIALSITFT